SFPRRRESRNPRYCFAFYWPPAFAWVTSWVSLDLLGYQIDSPEGGNDPIGSAPAERSSDGALAASIALASLPREPASLLRVQGAVEDGDLVEPAFPVRLVVAAPAEVELSGFG